jgi:hypothetical protein
MAVVHWLLRKLDRATFALPTLLYGPARYGVEKSALWERLLLVGMVALLLAWGILAAR